MSEAAAMFVTARCPRCAVRKPLSDFSPGTSACKPCRSAYVMDRRRAISAGAWAPNLDESYPRHTLAMERPVVEPAPMFPLPPAGADAALSAAIHDYFRAYGFTRLRTATEALITELAKNKRVDLAREGWIA